MWSALGLRLSQVAQIDAAARSMAWLNSALVSAGVCAGVVWLVLLLGVTYAGGFILVLGIAGGLLLWLSLALGVQGLFYGVLVLWGSAVVLGKLTYFPAPGRGITTMGLVLLLWGFLWWLERTPDAIAALRQERLALRQANATALTLLWCYPVAFDTPRGVVQAPLRQTMVLVWGLGLALLGRRALVGALGWSWVWASGLGTSPRPCLLARCSGPGCGP